MSFLVIEGLDGSGKSTQIKMLHNYLSSNNISYKYIHFPRTDSKVFGELIARFLRGEFGNIDEVDPYLIALIYAGDRKDAADQIREWMEQGYLVLVDRYVHSNIAFQCAKLSNMEDRKRLKDWINYMEYIHFSIPKPDLNIFLDVPFDFTKRNLTNTRHGNDRDYLKGKTDIHEENLGFQSSVRDMYFWQMGEDPSFQIIQCYDNENYMLDQAAIFEKIMEIIKPVLKSRVKKSGKSI